MTDIEQLQKFIDESQNIVFFGGAGVSTASGIPDFRSPNGLYAQNYGNKAPEYILSSTCWKRERKLFYKFYFDKILMNGQKIEPNIIHKKLAELESIGKLKAIITQNIDTLHQDAGSKNVYQVHGTTFTNHCIRQGCNKEYSIKELFERKNEDGIPVCDCGSAIKPDVTLYEEKLPSDAWENSVKALKNADMLIIAGTSLVVYPAASLLNYFHGDKLVILNLQETEADSMADLVIHKDMKDVFEKIIVG